MSSRKSTLSKIIRAKTRLDKRRKSAVDRQRKPGETDAMMEARMKRDLGNWLDMMSEREVEEKLLAAVEETKKEET